MKKLALAFVAATVLSAPALAADMAPRYSKAPMMAPVANWTGFYIFGGAGGGLWAADTDTRVTATGAPLTVNRTQGGSGWFGTVGLGYDWQFNGPWVVGLLADGQFGSIRGTVTDPVFGVQGTERMQDAWAAGARLGYLVAPNVLSYVNGGYSGSHWSGTNLISSFSGLPVGAHTNSFNRNGWFIGGGVENNLNIFGINAPGWFMKTEYRSAYYGRQSLAGLVDGTNAPIGVSVNFRPWVQTVSTSLVYRFNTPVVAKY
jgi:outer membrane immunogenic protein